MSVAFDASAVLALLFGERGGEDVGQLIDDAAISAVNLAEIVSKLRDSGYNREEVERAIDGLLPAVVPFDSAQAVEAGMLREDTRKWGLSLGDRACLALARRISARVLTADRAWAELEIGVDIELIR